MTPCTTESLRQSLMTYEVKSQPNGTWTISHPNFAGGRPFILFATESQPALCEKLCHIMAVDSGDGPGTYAESLGNGHFRQLYERFARDNQTKVSGVNPLDLDIDL